MHSSTAQHRGLATSLLERLIGRDVYARTPGYEMSGGFQPEVMTKLINNYRAHPMLLEVPNKLFYDNELVSAADTELTYRLPNVICMSTGILSRLKIFYALGYRSSTCCPVGSYKFANWEHLLTKGVPLVFHGIEGKDEREGSSPSWLAHSMCQSDPPLRCW